MSSIKAVTFDLDGVYFSGESFKKFQANLPRSVADLDRVNFALYKSPEILAFKRGEISEDDYWNFVRKELGVTISNEQIFSLLRDSYVINQEVQNYVREVRAKGLKTCICSNNFSTRIRELDARFNFLQDFDVKIFSYEVGIMKPDKGIFEALVEQSGVKAEEIVYSDDDESKLQGALELGINAFVFTGFEDFKQRVNILI